MTQTEMQQTISHITDVFAGGDGGVNFLNFKCLMEAMEEQSMRGDESAKEVCKIVYTFKRLLDYAKNRN